MIRIGVFDEPNAKELCDAEDREYRDFLEKKWVLEYLGEQTPTVEINGTTHPLELIFTSDLEGYYREEDSIWTVKQDYIRDAVALFREKNCAAVIRTRNVKSEDYALFDNLLVEAGIPLVIGTDAHGTCDDPNLTPAFGVTYGEWHTGTGNEDIIYVDFAVDELGASSFLFVDDSKWAEQQYSSAAIAYAQQRGCTVEQIIIDGPEDMKQLLSEQDDWDVIYACHSGIIEYEDWTYVLEDSGCEAAVIRDTGSYSLGIPDCVYYFDSYINNHTWDAEYRAISKWMREEREAPGFSSGGCLTFDAFQVLLKALSASTGPDDLAETLMGTTLDGMTGEFHFDETGTSVLTSISYINRGEWHNYRFEPEK